MRHLPSMSPCAVRGSDVIERSACGKRRHENRQSPGHFPQNGGGGYDSALGGAAEAAAATALSAQTAEEAILRELTEAREIFHLIQMSVRSGGEGSGSGGMHRSIDAPPFEVPANSQSITQELRLPGKGMHVSINGITRVGRVSKAS